ncbi:kinase-like domain-containing protein [Globomyces pollinis-pini]|nr:kinase-like domain-containing protein [Globomyces pollinis-pini]
MDRQFGTYFALSVLFLTGFVRFVGYVIRAQGRRKRQNLPYQSLLQVAPKEGVNGIPVILYDKSPVQSKTIDPNENITSSGSRDVTMSITEQSTDDNITESTVDMYNLNNKSNDSTVIGKIPQSELTVQAAGNKIKLKQVSTMYDVRLAILKKITGSGGVGNVYLAVYDQKQAVAKIPIDSEHENLVYEESRLMSKLRSPWVVESLAFMSDAMILIPGLPDCRRTALIIEFMNLGSFSKYLTVEPVFNLKTLLIQVAKGIEFMHSNSFVHLDLKPDNILLHQTNTTLIAKLSDFGSTQPIGSEEGVFQTKGYIPPEARFSTIKTEKYDIYAFGNILINVLTRSNVNVWWGFDKSWSSKRDYLKKFVRNNVVVDLIMACIHDDPQSRPTATDLVLKLSSLEQRDFEPLQLMVENSRLSHLGLQGTTSQFKSTFSSSPYQMTAGEFLFKQLELKSPTPWNQFQQSFKNTLVPDSEFDFERLKKQIKPRANLVSSSSVSNTVFKTVSPLLDGDLEEVWIEDMLDEIDSLVKEFQI